MYRLFAVFAVVLSLCVLSQNIDARGFGGGMMGGGGPSGGGMGGGMSEMRGPDFDQMAKDMIAEMDNDSNGSVDEAEYLSYYKRKFAKIDEDSSGKVTVTELKAAIEDEMPNPHKRR